MFSLKTIVSGRLTGLRPFALLLLAISGVQAVAADSLQTFYINYATGRLEVREFDPMSGQLIRAHEFIDPGGAASPFGLAWHGDRLVTLIINQFGDRGLVDLHPGTGVGTIVCWTPIQSFNVAVESDPATGRLMYMIEEVFNQSRFYTINANTGVALAGPLLRGATTYLDTFCVDRLGRGWATRNRDLYTVDLNSGVTTFLGQLSAPSTVVGVIDLAISRNGQLVGTFVEGGPPYAWTGLYTVDGTSLSATPLVLMPGHATPAIGVAFAPDKAGTTYCQSKPNSLGCLPFIASHGFPSITADRGFDIACNQVRNNSIGALLFGFGGPASLPFQGGTLCITGPTRRTPSSNSAGTPPGTPACDGVWTVDFNTHLWQHQPQSLPPGTAVYAQWYGRDMGQAAPDNVTLSDALRFELMP